MASGRTGSQKDSTQARRPEQTFILKREVIPMKRIIAIALAVLAIVSCMTACGSKKAADRKSVV